MNRMRETSTLTGHRALDAVRAAMDRACADAHRAASAVSLIAVSKTMGEDALRPVIAAGHRVFGENRVQEAQRKWPHLRSQFPDLELHLIGPLQTNKVKDAVALFDVIQTLDRDKLARKIAVEIHKQRHAPQLFVQVNTGEEPQKAGVAPEQASEFVARCRDDYGLAIAGLMCIPPADQQAAPHFALLQRLAGEMDLPFLSMGMSADYEMAIMLGATHIRVGTAIFGQRISPGQQGC